jgi:hypothetical protein
MRLDAAGCRPRVPVGLAHQRRGEALREIFSELPNPDWLMSTPPEAGKLAPPLSR